MVNNLSALVIMLFYGVLSGSSAILLKKGILNIGGTEVTNFWKEIIPTFISLIKEKIWLIGAIFSLTGFLIYFIALNFFELSIVKPLVNTNLLFTFLLSAFYLKERMQISEWVGLVILIVGLLLFGLSPVSTIEEEPNLIFLLILLPISILFVLLMITFIFGSRRSETPEFVFPIFAGSFYGIGTIFTKGIVYSISTFNDNQSDGLLILIFCLVMYLANYFFAIVSQMLSFEHGRLSIVSPITNSLSIITSFIGASLIFNEQILVLIDGNITFISFFKIFGLILLLLSLFLLRREIISQKTS